MKLKSCSLSTKPPSYQAAFTLLELIIVIVVLGIVMVYVQTRPHSASDYQQDTLVEQIISAASLTQQLSMNDSARAFSLVIDTNQIDLIADGVSFDSPAASFPIIISAPLSLSPVSRITFDRFGQTAATNININGSGVRSVCFETSGFIHRC